MEPPRADVLHAVVYMRGDPGNLGDSIIGEDELRSLCFDECRVLFGERVFGFGHDADEVRFGQ